MQHGVFTRAQAIDAGMSNGTIGRRVEGGIWERLYLGVYRFSASPPSWRGNLLAACFAWGGGTLASHRSAAAVWGLHASSSDPIELTVPSDRERELPHRVHRVSSCPKGDVTVVDAIPVTTVARTLLDLAATCPAAFVEEALDEGVRRRLVTLPRLRQLCHDPALTGRRGIKRLRALVDARDVGVPESVLEARLLRVLRAARLPVPNLQHVVRSEGRFVARVDFAYPTQRLAIEADGLRWHGRRADFERDARRHSRLASLGWRVVRVTWLELDERPAEVVATIGEALRA